METPRSHSDSKIVISILNQAGDRILYKVEPTTKINSILKKYCKDKELDYEALSFLRNGNRFPRTGSVEQCGFKDMDEIEVMRYSSGGGGGGGGGGVRRKV